MFGINDHNNDTQTNDQAGSAYGSSSTSMPSFAMNSNSNNNDNPALPPEPTSAPPTKESIVSPSPDITPDTEISQVKSENPEPEVEPSQNSDLLGIKQQALTQLSPIVSHLDQDPEEKFKTLMMMIQASDNQGLIKDAYEAAEQITDEKSKAQALLDVVNEINYFTQAKQN